MAKFEVKTANICGKRVSSSANCSAACVKLPYCGDAFVDTTEECDCGDDPASLPAGCPAANGGTGANCETTCLWRCNADLGDTCDPTYSDHCCAGVLETGVA